MEYKTRVRSRTLGISPLLVMVHSRRVLMFRISAASRALRRSFSGLGEADIRHLHEIALGLADRGTRTAFGWARRVAAVSFQTGRAAKVRYGDAFDRTTSKLNMTISRESGDEGRVRAPVGHSHRLPTGSALASCCREVLSLHARAPDSCLRLRVKFGLGMGWDGLVLSSLIWKLLGWLGVEWTTLRAITDHLPGALLGVVLF